MANPVLRAKTIIWFDCLAGLTAGVLLFLLAPTIVRWHGWTDGFVRFIGLMNIAYGCYSGSVAILFIARAHIPAWRVLVLIGANAFWAFQCLVQVWLWWGIATPVGIGHLALEAIFVGGLAVVEARFVLPAIERSPEA